MEKQPSKTPENSQDFSVNPQDYFKKSDYDVNIAPVIERIERLENRVKDHSALAASFKEAFEHDKEMDKVLVNLIEELVKTDPKVKKAVLECVKDIDRKWWNKAWKKALTAVGAVALVVLGAILQANFG